MNNSCTSSSSTNSYTIKCNRGGNISADQKKEMIDFLDKHPELRSGKFTSEFTFKKAQLLWTKLTQTLNCLPGAKKDWKQWRRTWQDMKSIAKKKKSIIRNYETATGGGPAIDVKLTPQDQRVLDILGPIVTEGDMEIEESSCSFVIEDHNYAETEVVNNIVDDMTGQVEAEEESHNNIVDDMTGQVEAEEESHDISEEVTSKDNSDPTVSNPRKSFSGKVSESTKVKKPVRVRRLEQSLDANAKLVQLTEKKIELKERNLVLYERDVVAKEYIATTLQELCTFFINQKKM